MNDKTIELLNQLAEKFGTTVEHLWGVLVKQAGINAASEVVGAIVLVLVWVALFRFVRAKTTCPAKTENERYPHAYWEEEGALTAWLGVTVVGVLTLIQACCALSITATALINPEYWALKQLMP